MDHFALPGDALHTAWQQGTLHRNFMGYTTQHSGLLLGLGVSAISDLGVAFAQNHKTLHDYYECLKAFTSEHTEDGSDPAAHDLRHPATGNSSLPVVKGYSLTNEDVAFRKYILEVICRGSALFQPEHLPLLQQYTFPELKLLEADQLIEWNSQGIQVTGQGRHFLRNICKAFDLHLLRQEATAEKPLFSKAI